MLEKIEGGTEIKLSINLVFNESVFQEKRVKEKAVKKGVESND